AWREDLERYPAIHGVLPCLVNDAHSPASDLSTERVIAKSAERLLLGPLLVLNRTDEDLELLQALGAVCRMVQEGLLRVNLLSSVEAAHIAGKDVLQLSFALSAIRSPALAVSRHSHHLLASGYAEASGDFPCHRRSSSVP